MTNEDDAPKRRRLSVVVAAWTGTDALERCLGSLLAEVQPGDDEIIVARNFEAEAAVRVAESARVVDLALAPGVTVPQLRAAGLAAATGTVVAFIEDHCVVAPGWRDALVRAYERRLAAVGGPVDLAAGGRPLDWAVYFYDYSRFAPPMRSGPVRSLSGTNMSFARTFLDGSRALLQEEVLEVVLEQEIGRQGLTMYLDSGALVIHGVRHSAARAVPLAFDLARGYAARRVQGASLFRRIAFAAGTPLLPFLLASRILTAVLRQGHLGRLTAAVPWLAVLLVAWSSGECAGYLAGAGDSDRRWC